MHYVIGFISSLAALVFAVHRLQRAGLDLDALNPFLWFRRTRWRKKYAEKPLYTLSEPVDVAAVLLLGVAKCEGELSLEHKDGLLTMYEKDLGLRPAQASDLLVASSFLLRDEVYVLDHLEKIVARSLERFTDEQRESVLELMERAARLGGPTNEEQRKLIAAAKEILGPQPRPASTWG